MPEQSFQPEGDPLPTDIYSRQTEELDYSLRAASLSRFAKELERQAEALTQRHSTPGYAVLIVAEAMCGCPNLNPLVDTYREHRLRKQAKRAHQQSDTARVLAMALGVMNEVDGRGIDL